VLLQGVGLKVSDFEIVLRIQGSGFQVSGVVCTPIFRFKGFEFRVSGLGFRVSGFGFRV